MKSKTLLVIAALFALWSLFGMVVKFVFGIALFGAVVYFGYKGIKKYLWN